ncbi:MAG: alpha/beta fold hydrolase [Calditrichia bacterium]|jgi:pimeloyl-ACP methyl ester carboxylesterase|nr:alpha/beta fold hydrolase [Calditrichia bacterium]
MKLYCRQIGNGDPVVILHGLFGISDNWLTIAKQLSSSHHCYILDMRNHGRSPNSQDLNYDDMVEDIYEFLTDFGLRTVSFIGHSMGGMVAMKFAFEYSHRIEKLVIVDIAPKSYPALHQNILKGLQSIPIDKIKSRREADEFLKEYVSSHKTRQFLLKNLYRKDDNSYAWRVNLEVIYDHASDIGHGISTDHTYEKPTLFIRGEKSDYILPEDEQRIIEIFPHASIIEIPGATHWVHAEKPSEFLVALRSFL